jgi:hypothetical protein
MTRLSTSRPIWSVPKIWRSFGGLDIARKSDFNGSYGAKRGAASAIRIIAAATHPQKADRGERLMNLRNPACASGGRECSTASAVISAG